MYYVNFDENGNQAELKFFDGITPEEDGWYEAGPDILGKRFKLVGADVVEMTPEEIQEQNDSMLLNSSLEYVRRERSRRLLESDWTVNPQVPMIEEKAAAWASYRQALRDFPASLTIESFRPGAELNWPVPPS